MQIPNLDHVLVKRGKINSGSEKPKKRNLEFDCSCCSVVFFFFWTVLFLIRVTNTRSLLSLKAIAGGDSTLMLRCCGYFCMTPQHVPPAWFWISFFALCGFIRYFLFSQRKVSMVTRKNVECESLYGGQFTNPVDNTRVTPKLGCTPNFWLFRAANETESSAWLF